MNEREVRIGILGGTFNPIHVGHLILAQSALELLDLSKVLFVPASIPPHKDPSGILPPYHRLAMVEASIEDDLRFEVCDLEIRRSGPSYSIDTVRELRRMHPHASLHFLIGSDTLPELHLWKDIHDLLKLCHFAPFSRPGFDPNHITESQIQLAPPWPERLLKNLFPGRLVDISSSDIRHRVAEGMSIRYLVRDSVEMYIAEHGLYRL